MLATSLRCEGKLMKTPAATLYIKDKRPYATHRFLCHLLLSLFSGVSQENEVKCASLAHLIPACFPRKSTFA